jgi:hypothetical protein
MSLLYLLVNLDSLFKPFGVISSYQYHNILSICRYQLKYGLSMYIEPLGYPRGQFHEEE